MVVVGKLMGLWLMSGVRNRPMGLDCEARSEVVT